MNTTPTEVQGTWTAAAAVMDRGMTRVIPQEAKDKVKRRLFTDFEYNNKWQCLETASKLDEAGIISEQVMETGANAQPGDREDNPLIIDENARPGDSHDNPIIVEDVER